MYLKLQLKTIKLLPTGLPSLYLKPTSPQFFVKKEQLELATRCRLKGVVSRLLAASEVPSEADGGEPPVGCRSRFHNPWVQPPQPWLTVDFQQSEPRSLTFMNSTGFVRWWGFLPKYNLWLGKVALPKN